MGVGSELQELGRFLDDCERRIEAVDSLNVIEVTDVGERRLTADLELRLSIDPPHASGTTLCDPRVGPDGTVRFALEPTAGLPLSTDHDVSVTPTDVALDADDAVTVTLAATVPADEAPSRDSNRGQPTPDDAGTPESAAVGSSAAVDGGDVAGDRTTVEAGTAPDGDRRMDGDGTTTTVEATDASPTPDTQEPTDSAGGPYSSTNRDTAAGSSGPRVPPFEDPELLADVYESCDTFAAMAEEIDMDVTGETVRRYMIQHDIHEPTSYQTSGDDATGQPVALADGIGLPDDVTVETLIETVKNSNTIHQVKRDIDIEREDALEMLKELNLLDLVVGRLATEGEREITREDVIDCLREASAVQ